MSKLAAFILSLMSSAYASDNILNVYNWTDYIPQSVISRFEQQTGITVNYNEFSSSDEMYTKLSANPNIGYDVVFPPNYLVTRMAQDRLLQPLDLQQLPNARYIDPLFLNHSYDPNNQYSLPFSWGATIIGYNQKYFSKATITSWRDLWQPRFSNQLLLLNDIRDVFAIPLLIMGASVNSREPQQIQQAYKLLNALWPNIKIISGEGIPALLADEDIVISVAWNGDIYSANQENPAIKGIYPKEGFALWMDNVVIMRQAPHVTNAYRFINFILQPENMAEIAQNTHYSTVNYAAKNRLPKAMRMNPILYPPAEIIKHAQFEGDVGEADHLYKSFWEEFRANA